MTIIDKIGVISFVILSITAIIFKIDDQPDEKGKNTYRYIFFAAVSFLVFTPNMHEVQSGQFSSIALYALGTWFTLEFMTLLSHISPALSELRDTLARSKDLKRSLDKASIAIGEHTDDAVEQLDKISTELTRVRLDELKEIRQLSESQEEQIKGLHRIIINLYSNLSAYDVNPQILTDFKNQLSNHGLALIDEIDVDFDSVLHISSKSNIDTPHPELNKKVAKVLKAGLKTHTGEILDSAVVSRYVFVENQCESSTTQQGVLYTSVSESGT